MDFAPGLGGVELLHPSIFLLDILLFPLLLLESFVLHNKVFIPLCKTGRLCFDQGFVLATLRRVFPFQLFLSCVICVLLFHCFF